LTTAENVTLPVPVTTLAEVGAIVTVTAGGVLLSLLPPPLPPLVLPPPQAANNPVSSTGARLAAQRPGQPGCQSGEFDDCWFFALHGINRKTCLPNVYPYPMPIRPNRLRTCV
jgi:hypothetical protein